MKNNFAKALGLGVVVVLIVVAVVFFMQRGAYKDLPGQVTARTLGYGKDESLALLELHLSNPSDYPFVVHDIKVTLETKAGNVTNGIVARSDAERLFASMPQAGPFHPTLYTDATIQPRTTGDYTLAVPFSMPEQMLKDRQRFVVHIAELGGKSFDYSEKQ